MKRMCTGKFKYSFSKVKDLALFSGANIDLLVMATSLIVAGFASTAGQFID